MTERRYARGKLASLAAAIRLRQLRQGASTIPKLLLRFLIGPRPR